MATVSVVIPTYNSARFLGEALDSVTAQSFRDLEIIVVDDGSTDDTPALLARYGEQITRLRQAQSGPAAARNAGLAAARGEFVAFLDADNFWVPTKLERQLPRFRGRPQLGLVFSDAVTFDAQGVRSDSWLAERPGQGNWTFERLLSDNFICTSTVVARRECFARVGGFDPELRSVEDREMWLRIAAEYELDCVPEPLAWWRFHEANLMWDRETALTCLVRVLRKARRLNPGRVRRCGAPFRRALARAEFDLGQWRLEQGQRRDARGHFGASLGEWPWRADRYLYWLVTFLRSDTVAALRGLRARRRRGGDLTIDPCGGESAPGSHVE